MLIQVTGQTTLSDTGLHSDTADIPLGHWCSPTLNLRQPTARFNTLLEDHRAPKPIRCRTHSVSAHTIYNPRIIHKRCEEAQLPPEILNRLWTGKGSGSKGLPWAQVLLTPELQCCYSRTPAPELAAEEFDNSHGKIPRHRRSTGAGRGRDVLPIPSR